LGTGATVGIVIGVVMLLVGFLVCLACSRRRHWKRQQQQRLAMQRTLELETAPGNVTPEGNAYGSIPRLPDYDANGASYGGVEFLSARQQPSTDGYGSIDRTMVAVEGEAYGVANGK
jgi:hypothetical protein